MRIQSYGISDIGRKRQNNEDVFAILEGYGFYALADGMGGHQAGEIAAQMTIDTLCRYIVDGDHFRFPLPSFSLLLQLSQVIQETNQYVHNQSTLRKDWAGMGTTLSCLLLHEDLLLYGHVGDSRIYRYRGHLEQITKDHTSRCEKKKGKITKAIGTSSSLEPEVGLVAPLADDRFLICSDGLTDYLSAVELEEALAQKSSLSSLCEYLVHCANGRGGHDNITILALQIEDI